MSEDQEFVEPQSDDTEEEYIPEDEDQGEEAQSEESPGVFMSEDEVPEGLKAQWKLMNKRFTQRMQELSAMEKELKRAVASAQSNTAPATQATATNQGWSGDPAIDSDPILQGLAHAYQERIASGEVEEANSIALQFQQRMDTLVTKRQTAKLEALVTVERLKSKPEFAPVWDDKVTDEVVQRILKGYAPEEAAWSVLGPKAHAKAVLEAHESGRKVKEKAEKSSTPPVLHRVGTFKFPSCLLAMLSNMGSRVLPRSGRSLRSSVGSRRRG